MATRQLHLFPSLKPLLERLGEDFFRRAPTKPGVYLMTGIGHQVLYVGQSGNLRARLNTYKNARSDRAPRKVVRLVHQVTSISWETCATPLEAKLRENELIRLHRPRFNRLNTFPGRYPFIFLNHGNGGLEIGLTRNLSERHPEIYGAFKGGASLAYAALLRRTWSILNQPGSLADYPSRLLSPRPPSSYLFNLGADPVRAEPYLRALRQFLSGSSRVFLSQFPIPPITSEATNLFQQRFWETDLETLERFYTLGAQKLATFKRHSASDHLPQQELDDWLVLVSEPPPLRCSPYVAASQAPLTSSTPLQNCSQAETP